MGRVLFIDSRQPDPVALQAAVEVIQQGGVVLSPTDTVYGLACDPGRPEAIGRVRKIKGSVPEKGFLLLISTPEWVRRLGAVTPRNFGRLKHFWPGPVTFLFAAGPEAPEEVVSSEQKIGLRCPDDVFLRAWLESLMHPLLSTSANRSGEEPPATTLELREAFEDSADLLLLAREPQDERASTVVDLTTDPARIVRRGEGADRVEAALTQP